MGGGVLSGLLFFISFLGNEKFMNLPYSSNRLLVRLKLDRLVHVGLPVLDEAIVVARHHPTVVVRPDHRAHGHSMSLRGVEIIKNCQRSQIIELT